MVWGKLRTCQSGCNKYISTYNAELTFSCVRWFFDCIHFDVECFTDQLFL